VPTQPSGKLHLRIRCSDEFEHARTSELERTLAHPLSITKRRGFG
jgi:hypothetical protein